MIQYSFPSSKPLNEHGALSILHGGNGSIKRSAKFTTRILLHNEGSCANKVDTSLSSLKKVKEREKKLNKLLINEISQLNDEFQKHVDYINSIKYDLAATQNNLALKAVQDISATSIQLFYRGWKSRLRLKRLLCVRFLSTWITFKKSFRKRKYASITINKNIRCFLSKKQLKLLKTRWYAAIKIQCKFKHIRSRKILMVSLKSIRYMKQFLNHIFLFGTRKAVKAIILKEEEAKIEGIFLKAKGPLSRMITRYFRRKRLQLMRGPDGKLLFYLLSNLDYHGVDGIPMASNFIIDHIKQNVSIPIVDKLQQSDNTKYSSRRKTLNNSGHGNRYSMNQISTSPRNTKIVTNDNIRRKPGDQGSFDWNNQSLSNTNENNKLRPVSHGVAKYSTNDLPRQFIGHYGPKTFGEVVELYLDLKHIALENPSCLEDIYSSLLHSPLGTSTADTQSTTTSKNSDRHDRRRATSNTRNVMKDNIKNRTNLKDSSNNLTVKNLTKANGTSSARPSEYLPSLIQTGIISSNVVDPVTMPMKNKSDLNNLSLPVHKKVASSTVITNVKKVNPSMSANQRIDAYSPPTALSIPPNIPPPSNRSIRNQIYKQQMLQPKNVHKKDFPTIGLLISSISESDDSNDNFDYNYSSASKSGFNDSIGFTIPFASEANSIFEDFSIEDYVGSITSENSIRENSLIDTTDFKISKH
eukprot:gene16040-21771_t